MDRKPWQWRTRDETAFARKLRRDTSKTEKRLWPHLRSGLMGAPFRRQHPIGEYFVDYCCVPLRLVIEVDGPAHDVARDSSRDARLAAHGFEVMRFSVQEMDWNLDGVVATIHAAVQARLMARQVKE